MYGVKLSGSCPSDGKELFDGSRTTPEVYEVSSRNVNIEGREPIIMTSTYQASSAVELTQSCLFSLAAGESHSCAVKNGNVKCWGLGTYGELGQGNTNDIGDGPNEMGDNLLPIALGASRTAKQIVANTFHTCALLDNNSIKCWGFGGNGRLGQGNTNYLGDGPNEMGDNLFGIILENF